MKRIPFLTVLILITLIIGTGCQADPADESNQFIPIADSSGGTSDQTDATPAVYPAPEAEEPVEGPDDEVSVVAAPYPEPDELPSVVSLPFVIIGEHDYSPIGGDLGLDRGKVFIESSDIELLESFPVQVRLHLLGNLPTPCHHLRAVVSDPEPNGDVNVEVYSVTDPEMMCVQVLHPFEAVIPIGDFTSGSYVLYVNGERVGNFDL